MKKISSFLKSHFSTLLVGLVFALGCDCCCECKDEQVSTMTINTRFFPGYPGRSCAIPIPSGALTGVGGNIVTTLGTNGSPFLTPGAYYLWVEFESCCTDFATSDEFRALVDAGTAYSSTPSGSNKRVLYTIALNTTAGSTSPTIPFPTTSSSGGSIHGGMVHVKYYEPCMNGTCDSPYPCPSSTTSYRPYYESSALIPRESDDPYADVSTAAVLTHIITRCNNGLGYFCGQ